MLLALQTILKLWDKNNGHVLHIPRRNTGRPSSWVSCCFLVTRLWRNLQYLSLMRKFHPFYPICLNIQKVCGHIYVLLHIPSALLTVHWSQARLQNCEKRLLSSSCLSDRPHGTTRHPLDGFWCKLALGDFSKTSLKYSRSIKMWQE